MAISAPVTIGTNATAVAGVVGSFALTTAANIVAGDLVVVGVALNTNNGVTAASISDGTNTYTNAGTTGAINGVTEVSLWYKLNASAVSSGGTITVTLSGNTSGAGNGLSINAARVAKDVTALDYDQFQVASSVSASTVTATTGTLARPESVAIGFAYDVSGSYSGASGFTNTNASSIGAELDYKLTSATSAVSFSPAFTAAGRIGAVVAIFKATSFTLASGIGSFSETGVAALFKVSQLSSVGSYSLTGNTATFKPSMLSAAGSYAISGQAATFGASFLSAAASYSVSGQAATFKASLLSDAGSYIVTGNAALFANTFRRPLYLRGSSYWKGHS